MVDAVMHKSELASPCLGCPVVKHSVQPCKLSCSIDGNSASSFAESQELRAVRALLEEHHVNMGRFMQARLVSFREELCTALADRKAHLSTTFGSECGDCHTEASSDRSEVHDYENFSIDSEAKPEEPSAPVVFTPPTATICSKPKPPELELSATQNNCSSDFCNSPQMI